MNSKYLKIQLDDIIFESRNKAYGAYALRQSYGKRIKRGTVIGLGLFALLISSPLIATRLTPERIEVDNRAFEMSNVPPPPPKNDIVPPPPPPPPPPPKQIATIRFVPPVVSNDVETEPPMPKPDDITVNVAAQTVEGEKTETFVPVATVAAPPPPDVPETPAKPIPSDAFFTIVEQMPEFKDGTRAMFKYLSDNIKYPAVARENGIEETVYVGFIVWNDGSIRNVDIKRGRNASLNEEALRVVRMMPNWKAGRQNGKSVNVAFTIPIKFHLE